MKQKAFKSISMGIAVLMGMSTCQSAVEYSNALLANESSKSTSHVKKQNVLFIICDDLRTQLGCYGDPIVKTPNIDALAKNGITFNNAYCQQALCAPSRASLLTGARPDVTRVYDLVTSIEKSAPDLETLPAVFKKNGYRTISLGKVAHSTSENVDAWTEPPSFPGGIWWGAGYINIARSPDVKQYPSTEIFPTSVRDEQTLDGALASKAIQELKKSGNNPFFLAVGFIRPHSPFVAPKKYWDMYPIDNISLPSNYNQPNGVTPYSFDNFGEMRAYSDIPDGSKPILTYKAKQLIRGYYASVSFVDAQVGRIVNELKTLGLDKSTTIVLIGDNGYKLGEHAGWAKASNSENDTNVPLIISSPNLANKNLKTNSLVELIDIFPTLCDLNNLPVPSAVQGTSLKPIMLSPDKKLKSAAFSQFYRVGSKTMGYTVTDGRYRYIEWQDHITKKVLAKELYDHQSDPLENNNIANKPENFATNTRLSNLIKLMKASCNKWEYKNYNTKTNEYTNMTFNKNASRWETNGTFPMISSNWIHPNVNQQAAKIWIAPVSGKINISGTVKDRLNDGGDGCIVKVLRNSDNILWGPLDIGPKDVKTYDTKITGLNVVEGDRIEFNVDSKSGLYSDGLMWEPKIEYIN